MWNRLQNLPRDTRDTLFLLLVIAWIIAPQTGTLPLWCSAMAAAVLCWRGWIAWHVQPLPSRWWLLGLLIVACAATYGTHRTLLGRDAGVTFIVVLLALKTLELRAKRDAFVVFFLGFFTLLSNFFFSQSLLIAAAMLIGLQGLLTALVNSHLPVGKPPLLQAAKTAGAMALLGMPIMVVLFVLFPRVAPLWGVPDDAMRGRSGLSSTMEVGTIADLALDSSVAMRVRFATALPRRSDMYFRGPVLSTFDGRQWRALQSRLPPAAQLASGLNVEGEPLDYEVTLEANNRPWLMVLDASTDAPQASGYHPVMTPDLQWRVERPISDLLRYRAKSFVHFRHGPETAAPGLQDYLSLPVGRNPRTLALANEIRRDPLHAKANNAELVNVVMARLRTGGYTYTLDPGLFGDNTADEFWFDRKQGFCEHIASAFVVLMRAMQIPARVVTGYQGGEINSVDGYWTVRQSDAHAWTEVWLERQGWVRVDPTSAVAPGRTGSFQRLQAPEGIFRQALVNVSPNLAVQLRAIWEATNNRWNQWVLNYSQDKQMNLLRNLGFDAPSWEDLSYLLIGIIVAASLIGAAWAQWEKYHQDPWLRLLHKARHQLAKIGLELPANSPPRSLAEQLQRAPGLNPDAVAQWADWLLQLERWRYANARLPGSSGTNSLAKLRQQFARLPKPA
jgi:transglutaminase-like putative cysteine protease